MDKQTLIILSVALGFGLAVLCGIGVWGGNAYLQGVATQTAVAQTTATAQANESATTIAQAATGTAQANATETRVAQANATDAANANALATMQAPRTATAQVRTATAQAQQTAIASATARVQALQTRLAPGDMWYRVLSESFDQDTGRWSTGNIATSDGYWRRTIVNGLYRWEIQETSDTLRWVFANTPAQSDFYLTVQAQQVSGTDAAEWGVIFRKDTEGNYYYFAINQRGVFQFAVRTKQGWTTLIPWKSSSVIRLDRANRIGILAEGTHLTFLINDQLVGELDDTRAKSGSIGLVAEVESGAQAVFEFDDLEIRVPVKPLQTATPNATLTPNTTPVTNVQVP